MASVPFNNLITFSRGSNATLTGSNGLVQYAPNNLLTNSEQFDNANWTKLSATVVPNATFAPDGTITADALVSAAATALTAALQTVTVSTGAWVSSFYVKANGARYVQLLWSGVLSSDYANFDLQTGTVTAGTYTAVSITAAENGFYRISISSTLAAAVGVPYCALINNGTEARAPSFVGNGTSGVFIWGAQLELGSTATTYNSTTVKNLLGFSEAFDNAAWTKSGSSIVTGAIANPVNGAFNAQKLMEDTSTGQHRVFNASGIAYVALTPVCFSVYVKAAERSFVYVRVNNSGADFVTGFVSLTTGAVTTVTGAGTITATSVGNGWWRIAAIGTSPAATAVSGYIAAATSGSVVSYTGDGNSGVYIYGAQLSDSASLDAYVPTPGAAPSSTAYYGPRFDYDPVTLAPKGILIEEQRTNLLTYSEQFDNAAWTKVAASVSANTAVAPSGATVADTLIENTANSIHAALQGTTRTAGVATYTFSVFFKALGTNRYIRILISDGPTTNYSGAFVDPVTGTIVGSVINVGFTAGSVTITPVGNGWYRGVVTATTDAVSTGLVGQVYLATTASVTSYTGDGTSGVYLWGAQLELGAFATSYIPTIASTVTRSADVATITGSLFSQWYGQPQGTFAANFDDFSVGATFANVYRADDGTANNRLALYKNGSSTSVGFDVTTGGASQANIVAATASIVNPTKHAAAYNANDFAASVNGSAATTDTSGTVPSGINVLRVGRDTAGGAGTVLNGHIQSVSYYPVRAADFQLQALTT